MANTKATASAHAVSANRANAVQQWYQEQLANSSGARRDFLQSRTPEQIQDLYANANPQNHAPYTLTDAGKSAAQRWYQEQLANSSGVRLDYFKSLTPAQVEEIYAEQHPEARGEVVRTSASSKATAKNVAATPTIPVSTPELLKTTYGLSDAQLAALRVLDPSLGTVNQKLNTSQIVNTTLNPVNRVTAADTAVSQNTLSDFIQSARQQATLRTQQNAVTQQQEQQKLVQQLKSDPALYAAVTAQLQGARNADATAAAEVALATQAAQEAAAEHQNNAAEVFQNALAKAEEDAAANYTGYTDALGSYTQQQLAKGYNNLQTRETQNAQLTNYIDQLLAAAGKESNDVNAKLEDQVAAIQTALDRQTTKAAAQSKLNAAQSEAAAADAAQQAETLQQALAAVGDGGAYADLTPAQKLAYLTDVQTALRSGGSAQAGDYKTVTGNTQKMASLPNNVYNAVVNNIQNGGVLADILRPSTAAQTQKKTTVKDVARQLGVDYATSADQTADLYRKFATSANRQQSGELSKAQQAYVEALAAGDQKTLDVLTQLATNSSVSKGNLFGANRLATALQQQQQNNAALTDLKAAVDQSRIAQRQRLAQADTGARAAQNTWLTDATRGTGLRDITQGLNAAAANATAAYSSLTNNALTNISEIDQLRKDAVRKRNQSVASAADTLTGVNAANAATNTTNRSIANRLNRSNKVSQISSKLSTKP